jgi:CBS domain-containing membrane protein
MKNYLLKIFHAIVPETVQLSTAEKLRSALAVFAGILFTAYISSIFISGIGLPVLVASMGASSILLFAVTSSPLSQPWPLVGGNILPALIAVSCGKFVPDLIFAAALSVALSLFVMQILRCLHPPGGAMALIPLMG